MKKKHYNVEVIWKGKKKWSLYVGGLSSIRDAKFWFKMLDSLNERNAAIEKRIVRVNTVIDEIEEVVG